LAIGAFGLGIYFEKQTSAPLSVDAVPIEARVQRPFAVVIHARNIEAECEALLTALFSQDYDNYRLILIDDGSADATFQVAQDFILDAGQEWRSIVLRHDAPTGWDASFQEIAATLLPHEIIIPLQGKHRFLDVQALKRLNAIYEDKNVTMTESDLVYYPSYERGAGQEPFGQTFLGTHVRSGKIVKEGKSARLTGPICLEDRSRV
jgi:glycosyltransferase involved in cell wall biosynthesis